MSKYSLKAITLNPSCRNRSPAFTVTILPSTSKLTYVRLFDFNQIPKYNNDKVNKNIIPSVILFSVGMSIKINKSEKIVLIVDV